MPGPRLTYQISRLISIGTYSPTRTQRYGGGIYPLLRRAPVTAAWSVSGDDTCQESAAELGVEGQLGSRAAGCQASWMIQRHCLECRGGGRGHVRIAPVRLATPFLARAAGDGRVEGEPGPTRAMPMVISVGTQAWGGKSRHGAAMSLWIYPPFYHPFSTKLLFTQLLTSRRQ